MTVASRDRRADTELDPLTEMSLVFSRHSPPSD